MKKLRHLNKKEGMCNWMPSQRVGRKGGGVHFLKEGRGGGQSAVRPLSAVWTVAVLSPLPIDNIPPLGVYYRTPLRWGY